MPSRVIMERLIRRDEDDGSFDREFWRRVGCEGRLAAAWGMIVEAEAMRGNDAGPPPFDKSVERLLRRKR